MAEPFKFNTLNTSYVSLAALIRHLCDQQFTGRIHIALDQYESDVFLYGAEPPSVWETDRSSGREAQGEAAMQRLLVRSREPGGVITVFEGSSESTTTSTATPEPEVQPHLAPIELDTNGLVQAGQELIAAVERAVASTGADFEQQFHQARVAIGDDYPFIDPTVGGFEYSKSKLTLQSKPAGPVFIQAVAESLKRLVNSVAQKTDEATFRERVAAELALTVRRLPGGVDDFKTHLDRIAGTRVL